MNLINRIENKDELLSVRDHFKRVLADNLNLTLKTRRLDELTSQLLGAKDFNTALGIVSNDVKNTTEPNNQYKARASDIVWYLNCVMGEAFLNECILELDELVFDVLGTNKRVSDTINNAGLDAQIEKLLECVDENCIWTRFSEVSLKNKDKVTFEAFEDWMKAMPVIKATVNTDDARMRVEFDATDYFINESKKDNLMDVCIQLNEIDWGGDLEANYIARYFDGGGSKPSHMDVKNLFDYLDSMALNRDTKDRCGFECHVDKDSMVKWLKYIEQDEWKFITDL